MKKIDLAVLITIILLVACAVLYDMHVSRGDEGGASDGGTTENGGTTEDGGTTEEGNEEEDAATALAAKYAEAMEKLTAGEYETAYALLKELGDYENAASLLPCFDYFLVSDKEGRDEENDTYDRGFAMTLNGRGLPERIAVKGEDGETVYLFTYDDEGLLLRQTVTHPQGSESQTDYFYEEGRRVKITHQSADGIYHTEIAYDEKGNVTQTEDVGSENRLSFYTYDEEGRLTKILTREQDGTEYVCEYAYDEDGNCVREWVETPEKTTLIQRIYENGRLVEEALGDENGLHTITRTTYDGQGKAYRKTVTTRGGQTVTAYTYDENGRLTATVETDTRDESKTVTTAFYYDEAGRPVKEESVSAEGESTLWEREYLFAYRATDLPQEVAALLDTLCR